MSLRCDVNFLLCVNSVVFEWFCARRRWRLGCVPSTFLKFSTIRPFPPRYISGILCPRQEMLRISRTSVDFWDRTVRYASLIIPPEWLVEVWLHSIYSQYFQYHVPICIVEYCSVGILFDVNFFVQILYTFSISNVSIIFCLFWY